MLVGVYSHLTDMLVGVYSHMYWHASWCVLSPVLPCDIQANLVIKIAISAMVKRKGKKSGKKGGGGKFSQTTHLKGLETLHVLCLLIR